MIEFLKPGVKERYKWYYPSERLEIIRVCVYILLSEESGSRIEIVSTFRR